jgi:hypothetical protein
LVLVGLATVLLMPGCRKTSVGVGKAEMPVGPGREAMGEQVPIAGTTLAVESMDKLNVHVRVSPEDYEGKDAVQNRVQGKLADNGFQLTPSLPDIQVNISVETSQFDQSGNYYLFQGAYQAEILRVWDKRVLSKTEETVKGERKLGKTEATRSVHAKLAEAASVWIAAVCTPERSGLAVSDITISRPAGKKDHAAYARRAIRLIKEQDGVAACEQLREDETGRMVFRVVFFRSKFPEGMLNRLVSIPELEIETKEVGGKSS